MVMEQLKITGLYGTQKIGNFEGEQSLNNDKFYIFSYDPKTDDFVGKWVPRPDFLGSKNKSKSTNESNNEPEL